MKTMNLFISLLVGSASVAYTATSAQSEGAGILTYFFVGFFALIIVSQLIPALILFAGMVKGLFAGKEKSLAKND